MLLRRKFTEPGGCQMVNVLSAVNVDGDGEGDDDDDAGSDVGVAVCFRLAKVLWRQRL